MTMLTDDDLRKFLRPLNDDEVQALRHKARGALSGRPGMVAKGAAVLLLMVGVWLAASVPEQPEGAVDARAVRAEREVLREPQSISTAAHDDAAASGPARNAAPPCQP
jgi:hypothetical protein